MITLGIDIGGSGIKGAPVDTETGALIAERYRIPTPDSGKPQPIARVVGEICEYFNWQGPTGCGFPAAVQRGVVRTAANIHKKWVGVQAAELFSEVSGCPTVVMNDADAAGLAEMQFGAGRGRSGVVVIVTIGTGLGTSVFTNGCLVPNTELGHIEIDGYDAEYRASDAARKRDGLSWKRWGKRFNRYLLTLEKLLWPEVFILGGGVSKKHAKFFPYLTVEAEVLPAGLLNEAGIVGAALAARQLAEGTPGSA